MLHRRSPARTHTRRHTITHAICPFASVFFVFSKIPFSFLKPIQLLHYIFFFSCLNQSHKKKKRKEWTLMAQDLSLSLRSSSTQETNARQRTHTHTHTHSATLLFRWLFPLILSSDASVRVILCSSCVFLSLPSLFLSSRISSVPLSHCCSRVETPPLPTTTTMTLLSSLRRRSHHYTHVLIRLLYHNSKAKDINTRVCHTKISFYTSFSFLLLSSIALRYRISRCLSFVLFDTS